MKVLITLIQEMSVFAVIAYIYSKSFAFRPLISRTFRRKDWIYLYVFFSLLTIMGTYMGIPVRDAIANTRAIGAVLAGLIGGPVLGVAVGLTGGLHRYLLGGFTAFSCGVSTTAEGFIGGLFHLYWVRRSRPEMVFNFRTAFFATFVSEAVQMLIILLLSKPFDEAWALVQIIALPMIFANSVGAALFTSILKDQKNMIDEYGTIYSQKALAVAGKTLGILSRGFSQESAGELAKVIRAETGVGAVAITDRENVLAFDGIGADHHVPGQPISSQITKDAIATGEVIFFDGNLHDYNCTLSHHCPIGSALVIPLMLEGEVAGTVKLYEPKSKTFLNINKSFGEGIAALLSTQLHLSRYEEKKSLLVQAELKLLQAQINPHFLFNALNTIASVVRTNPERARGLILHLSQFFRKNLKRSGELVTVHDELEHVTSYLDIELARFEDRLVVDIAVDQQIENVRIPAFTLQPLVENAIKHGISKIIGEGRVTIRGHRDGQVCHIYIEDNAGTFCPSKSGESGLGMQIVDRRIKNLCGHEYGVSVDCIEGEVSRVTVTIPCDGCPGEGK